MNEVPSIWRPELVHPMLVHFPLVLLLCGTLAWVVGQWVDESGRWSFLLPAARLMLFVGASSAWAAVYTGHIADAEVVRGLCDPRVVEAHEDYATGVSILFSAAILLDLATVFIAALERWRKPIFVAVGLTFLAASALLGYVGHLGASLVYQQGAAVYQPSERCTEFE